MDFSYINCFAVFNPLQTILNKSYHVIEGWRWNLPMASETKQKIKVIKVKVYLRFKVMKMSKNIKIKRQLPHSIKQRDQFVNQFANNATYD